MDDILVKKISFFEYKSIVEKYSNLPIYFSLEYMFSIALNKELIILAFEKKNKIVCLFLAMYHRKAIMNYPYFQRMGWFPLINDITEEEKARIIELTMWKMPRHYFFDLSLDYEFIDENSIFLLDSLSKYKFKYLLKPNYLLNLRSYESFDTYKSQVSKYIIRQSNQAKALGFEFRLVDDPNILIKLSEKTAFRNGYNLNTPILQSIIFRYEDNTNRMRMVGIYDTKKAKFVMATMFIEYNRVAYQIISGYDTDTNVNLFSLLSLSYIDYRFEDIDTIDLAGSSIATIAKNYDRILAKPKNYIKISRGNRFNLLRLL